MIYKFKRKENDVQEFTNLKLNNHVYIYKIKGYDINSE